MKRNIFFLIIISILCWSCENNEFPQEPLLNIKVDTINAVSIDSNSIPVFTKGSVVKFLIDAEADMITFYSGEPGMMYKNRDRTVMDGKPYMTFDVQLEGTGMPDGYLQVLLSSDFQGFTTNAKTDSLSIINATWVDITDSCNIPIIPNSTNSSPKIDLSKYVANPLYVAFRYFRPANPNDWPRYQIRNFNIINVSDGFTSQVITSGNAGWSVFDLKAPAGFDPYNSTGGDKNNRTWDTRNASTDNRFYIGYGCVIDNDDWVITKNIDLTSVSPDLGEGIKSFSDDKITEYDYLFNNPGTYTVSFVAINSLYSNSKRIVKEITVKITE